MCLQTWDLDGPRLVPTILLDTRGSTMKTMMMEKRTLRKRQLSTRKSTMMMGRKRRWLVNLHLLHLFLLQGIEMNISKKKTQLHISVTQLFFATRLKPPFFKIFATFQPYA